MDPKKQMGFETEADKKVQMRAGDLSGLKRALWVSKEAWEIVEREAESILGRCQHLDGCPAATDETAQCLGGGIFGSDVVGCPDRELRLSALVILNAARQFESVDARRPAESPYFAPSREYFSKVLAELGAVQIENDELRAKLAVTTKETP